MCGAVPLPDRVTFAPALPMTASVADRVPSPVGLNVSGTVVEFPGATVIGLDWVGGVNPAANENSALLVPLIVSPLMMSEAVPEFTRVKAWMSLVVPTNWSVKLTAEGLGVMPGAVPVPVKPTFSGLPEAL